MYSISANYDHLIKNGEELCGDHIEVAHLKDASIFVLSDGLGSGVKANILATLTSTIALTMLKEGATLHETLDTIANTLPVCTTRKLAYSTFTILQIQNNGTVYAAEFDNPKLFVYKNKDNMPLERNKSIINEKIIYESNFKLDEKSLLVAVSDGVIHAGVGGLLDLGWQWVNVNKYIKTLYRKGYTAERVTGEILKAAKILYDHKPGDDTTVLSIELKERNIVQIFIGPPQKKASDPYLIQEFMKKKGKKIICGGTTANIFARELNEKIEIDIDTMTKYIPPILKLPGLDLVTEGVITLRETITIIQDYIHKKQESYERLKQKDGAAMLAKLLIEESSKVFITFGLAMNPTHQDSTFDEINYNIKSRQVSDLADLLIELNKEVVVTCV